MNSFYLQTGQGKMPIDMRVAKKYKLRAGMLSPNTGYPILNTAGVRGEPPQNTDDDVKHNIEDSYHAADEITNPNGDLALSTAEIIDISQGVDSSNG